MTPTTDQVAQTVPSDAQALARHRKLKATANKWGSQSFFGTMLKQMRNSPFKSQLFSGGRGGEAFATLYDQKLADRLSRGVGSKLGDSITRSIEGTRTYRRLEAEDKAQRSRYPGPARDVRNYVSTTV